jgi:hypothetical protein
VYAEGVRGAFTAAQVAAVAACLVIVVATVVVFATGGVPVRGGGADVPDAGRRGPGGDHGGGGDSLLITVVGLSAAEGCLARVVAILGGCIFFATLLTHQWTRVLYLLARRAGGAAVRAARGMPRHAAQFRMRTGVAIVALFMACAIGSALGDSQPTRARVQTRPCTTSCSTHPCRSRCGRRPTTSQ